MHLLYLSSVQRYPNLENSAGNYQSHEPPQRHYCQGPIQTGNILARLPVRVGDTEIVGSVA